ncbi:MAG TPA: NAD-dependent epimerase/dehydratase family protein [Rubrobacter sp.]
MILVTGGAGFIGSHVVDALLAAGEEPVVLDDFSSGDRANLPGEVEVVEADVADPGVVARISTLRPRAVVHAAAQVSVAASMQDPALDLAVNVGGTANVLAGARAAGAERFVFLSSGGGIYGETEGADENTLPRPKSYYGAHKYLAERYVELDGISYAIARLANVYGPRQRSDLEGGVVAIFAERLRKNLPVTINGSGEQSRDFVHVADVANALLVIVSSRIEGTWNVGTGRAISILELLRTLEAEIRPAVEVRHGPARQGDVSNSRLSIKAIERDLGWRPGYDLARGVDSMA